MSALADLPPPEWDLSDLYAGRDDPALNADFAAAEAAVRELAGLEGAIVGARGDPAALGERIDRAIRLYERITELLGAPAAYAGMAASVERSDPEWSRFQADVGARVSEIAAGTVFLTLELNRLEDPELEAALAAVPDAARWRPWLERVRAFRPHELAPDLERLLLDRQPATAQWTRLYDETLARLRVGVGGEQLTLNETLNRLSDPSAGRRQAAARGLTLALEQAAPVLSLCLNTVAQEKRIEDRWRRFADPAASRHLANAVDPEAVEAMVETVAERYPRLSHRYYALKAAAMGRKQLDHWDRNAPLDRSAPEPFPWPRAKGIVLDAFAEVSPDFADRARVFFEKPWIHARPKAGKASGAYAHPVTADRHPYVFLNFMGERRDVLTLAHEMGHAVHQSLARPLGTLLADTPLTLAETASIFAEGLVFDRLLAEASPGARRVLLAGRIEDGLNTVVRQVAFHRFETRFHAARAAGEVGLEETGRIWRDVMGESLGPAISLDEGYRWWWAYVSHFVHSPFYVYAYAFGDLLVAALMRRREEDPASFADAYRALLAAGGSMGYVEALQPFGLDPRERAFWATGCERLERLIDSFESLS
jgi:oligoendopeptidase F